jgi:hypothetical protein
VSRAASVLLGAFSSVMKPMKWRLSARRAAFSPFVEGADDRSQDVIPHFLGRLGSRQPLEFALAFLQPAGLLSLYLQSEDFDLARDNLPAFQTLFIREGPNGPALHPADDTRLFPSLPRSRFVGRFAFGWPPLRNDPSARLARSHQQDFGRRFAFPPIGQSCVLDTLCATRFSRLSHDYKRHCT